MNNEYWIFGLQKMIGDLRCENDTLKRENDALKAKQNRNEIINKKIIDYMLVFGFRCKSESWPETFEMSIKKKMEEGWQPFGYPHFHYMKDDYYCLQAMVKYED